jgi:hypothetical protein
MKDVVTVEIDAPQEKVAELFADPQNNPEWMTDLKSYQPLDGEPGMPGSTYRLVQQGGKLAFVVTVVERYLPSEVSLSLDSPGVAVSVRAMFIALGSRTRLISIEKFRFKGMFGPIVGLLAKRSIRRAHSGQMDAFKRFAEERRH